MIRPKQERIKVAYILNNAPNYRDVLLQELGKFVELTVFSFSGTAANLKDPVKRIGYEYVELSQRLILGISFQLKEFTALSGDYDVIILGFDIHRPFRFLNLLRKKRIIFSGLIYGRNEESFITRFARRRILPIAEGVLVYSDMIKEKLSKEISKPILSFNNTSFSEKDIQILPFDFSDNVLNLIWVGRYQKRKKLERLVNLARRNSKVNLRLIGPGIKENIQLNNEDNNIKLYSELYGDDLIQHFEWSHAIFNTGHAGLMVMNSARFGRPIFIDNDSYHAPEIQLAKDASQVFLDFGNEEEVRELVEKCITNRDFLIEQGKILANVMKEKFTVEYMAQQYLKAIKGEWE
jgi:glycosyltransferase involved in cell wall biosynthesis